MANAVEERGKIQSSKIRTIISRNVLNWRACLKNWFGLSAFQVSQTLSDHCVLQCFGLSQMSFQVGTRVGSYQITAPIGAGGMGEVYRARDTKLNRDVAIKALPDIFVDDADRIARFTVEAPALAS